MDMKRLGQALREEYEKIRGKGELEPDAALETLERLWSGAIPEPPDTAPAETPRSTYEVEMDPRVALLVAMHCLELAQKVEAAGPGDEIPVHGFRKPIRMNLEKKEEWARELRRVYDQVSDAGWADAFIQRL